MERGEIYTADLSPVVGSEQGGSRPVLIIQNNIGNKFSTTIVIAAITSKMFKHNIPTHVNISDCKTSNLPLNSIVMLEQIRTIDKSRVRGLVGKVSNEDMERVNKALRISLGV